MSIAELHDEPEFLAATPAPGDPGRRRRRPPQPGPRARLHRRRRRHGRRGGHLEHRGPAHPRDRGRRHLRRRRPGRRLLGRRARPQGGRPGHRARPGAQRRRLADDHHPPDAGRGHRPGPARRPGPGRRQVEPGPRGRRRVRSRRPVRVVVRRRCRRLHPRWRHGLAGPQARLRGRPHPGRRDRHRRRPVAPGLCRLGPRAVLGRPGRQGQPRHRDRAGDRARPGRFAVRRWHLLRRCRRHRGPARLPRVGAHAARRR